MIGLGKLTRRLYVGTRKQLLQITLMLGCLLLLGSIRPAFAQDVLVEATVDRNQLSTDDILQLTILVNAQPDVTPTLSGSTLESFQVVGTSFSSQTSIVNGATSSTFGYRFQLRPIQPGNIRIDEITVIVDNQRYQTNAITVEITQGLNPLPSEQVEIVPPTELSGQDFYVTARVDKETPYLGEQLLYVFQFYQALELLGRPDYQAPDFVGFWNQQENQQASTVSDVAGRTYRITSLFTPLFGTTVGSKLIDAAGFVLPDGRTLITEEVPVGVRPLPEPSPENFSGAVGQFALSSAIDKTVLAAGEAVTWRVVLGGVGNIETLPEPTWPELDGWRMFEDASAISTEFSGGIIQGERVYERILIPSVPGEFEMPSIVYGYFNPETEQYETAQTEPITFVVTEGEAVENGDVSAETSAPDILNQLAPLRPTPNRLGRPFNLIASPIFWSLWAIPLLLIAGDWAIAWRRERSDQREQEAQQRNALKVAQQAIQAARSENINLADQQAERILTAYLSDKFETPFVGLSQGARTQQLQGYGVRDGLIRWTNRLYDSAEGLRFGYKDSKPGKLLAEVEQLISRYERGDE